jgi:hypothetical protein
MWLLLPTTFSVYNAHDPTTSPLMWHNFSSLYITASILIIIYNWPGTGTVKEDVPISSEDFSF